jgi:hypothetical protein
MVHPVTIEPYRIDVFFLSFKSLIALHYYIQIL